MALLSSFPRRGEHRDGQRAGAWRRRSSAAARRWRPPDLRRPASPRSGARIGEASGTDEHAAARSCSSSWAPAIGYVLGGVFGRLTLQAVHGLETELGKKPPAVLAGGVGRPGRRAARRRADDAPAPVPARVRVVAGDRVPVPRRSGPLGYRLGQAKHEDIFGLVGMKPRAAGVRRGATST